MQKRPGELGTSDNPGSALLIAWSIHLITKKCGKKKRICRGIWENTVKYRMRKLWGNIYGEYRPSGRPKVSAPRLLTAACFAERQGGGGVVLVGGRVQGGGGDVDDSSSRAVCTKRPRYLGHLVGPYHLYRRPVLPR